MISQQIRVNGALHGVGFRPFVWHLAKELELTGWVKNDALGVDLEVQGDPGRITSLVRRLKDEAPERARIDSITVHETRLQCFAEDFYILNSRGSRTTDVPGHDTAVCHDCLGELFNPESRHWRHAFFSCSHCGPRYTIARALPYARERTSLKSYLPCAKCQNEIRRTGTRQHNNEAHSCPKCGPQLALLNSRGRPLAGDPVEQALALLKQGKILAIKGQGGFHLACDARNAMAVALLRQRRQDDQRPYVVMLANAISASALVQLGVGEPGLLAMPERPVLLLKKRINCDSALPDVTTGLSWQGVMMPCTPLHYLLFHEAAGRPEGLAWLDHPQDMTLVMSGAESASEPLITANEQALQRLSGIADAFLWHEHEIVSRCDDSIARSGSGGLQFLRRARGHAPRAIKLPRTGPPLLAVGGRFNNTVCMTRGDEAFVSPHIGDLNSAEVCDYFAETIAHLTKLLEVKPALVAHDTDPQSYSARFAKDYSRLKGVPALAVEYHHARVAAVLAEHQVDDVVTALSLDGAGGELLRVNGLSVERLGVLASLNFANVPDAGEPWQLAAAVLQQLGRGHEIEQRFGNQAAAGGVVGRQAGNLSGLKTSGLGCYVNAAAGLLGIKSSLAFEGQGAMLLEGLAEHHGEVAAIKDGWAIDNGCLSLWPMFEVLADEKNAERGAALFHATVIAALTDWVSGVTPAGATIVASGASFLDLVLARGLRSGLNASGLHLMEARRLPPNDGGLALGQAWVALQYLLD
ncbi:MAG: carbamoyltransferase HypF [Betaproteobacteria bacterium]